MLYFFYKWTALLFFFSWHLLGQITAPNNLAASDAYLENRPLVTHVVVALCDNENQGIVPVPVSLGNGQDPRNNLYWGALYGVKTFLTKKAGWSLVERKKLPDAKQPALLERIILRSRVGSEDVFLVADAWDGLHIKAAIEMFFSYCSGRVPVAISVEQNGGEPIRFVSGGKSHLLVFVGHNGLMEFSVKVQPPPQEVAPRAAFVLACASKPYFEDRLRKCGAKPVLLTTQLMAPEAYTLDAAVRTWFSGKGASATREAAAQAYNRYQKCGLKGARGLFAGADDNP